MSRSTGAERRVLHSLKHLPIALPQVARMWTHQCHTVWASFSITLPHEETAPTAARARVCLCVYQYDMTCIILVWCGCDPIF